MEEVDKLSRSFSSLTKEELVSKLVELSIEFNDFNKSSKEIEDLLESENDHLTTLNNNLNQELAAKDRLIIELQEKKSQGMIELEIENDRLSNELKASQDKYIELFQKFEFLQMDLTDLLNINDNLTSQNGKLNDNLNKFKFLLNQASIGLFNRDKLKVSKYKTPPINS